METLQLEIMFFRTHKVWYLCLLMPTGASGESMSLIDFFWFSSGSFDNFSCYMVFWNWCVGHVKFMLPRNQ
jgi:uncharacterized membrane protein